MLLDLNPWYKIVKEFKTYLRRWLIKKILGPRFSLDYNPVREWLNFIDLMKELYDFDMEGTIYTDFLIDNKAKTKDLIFADIKRYESKKDSMIFDYSKYIAHKKEIFFMKKKSFETGEPLDVKTLLSISENEKNLQILYHNFLKYKLHRMDLITNLLYETGSLTYDTTIDTVFVRSDVVGIPDHITHSVFAYHETKYFTKIPLSPHSRLSRIAWNIRWRCLGNMTRTDSYRAQLYHRIHHTVAHTTLCSSLICCRYFWFFFQHL
jgi:hypothetical protein